MIEDVLSLREQAQLLRSLPEWNAEADEPFVKVLEDMENNSPPMSNTIIQEIDSSQRGDWNLEHPLLNSGSGGWHPESG